MAASICNPCFAKNLDAVECQTNEMCIPWKFIHYHGNSLNDTVKLKIRNGYRIRVTFDREMRRFVGMHDLFSDFGLKGGEILLFEIVNQGTLNVFIVGDHLGEIKYPSVVHASQHRSPSPYISIRENWHFVHLVRYGEDFVDELVPPHSFTEKIIQKMPAKIKYVLDNGDEFRGYYHRREGIFTGFKQICDALGIHNFNAFTMLVFSYDWKKRFYISFYDARNVDMQFNANMLSGGLLEYVRPPSRFVVEVQPFHMLRYCHGVDIGVEFKDVTNMWGKNAEIRVFKGEMCWILQIRKRADWKRTCILNGWTTFRDDVELAVGDKVVFQWKDESYEKFTFEVIKEGTVSAVGLS